MTWTLLPLSLACLWILLVVILLLLARVLSKKGGHSCLSLASLADTRWIPRSFPVWLPPYSKAPGGEAGFESPCAKRTYARVCMHVSRYVRACLCVCSCECVQEFASFVHLLMCASASLWSFLYSSQWAPPLCPSPKICNTLCVNHGTGLEHFTLCTHTYSACLIRSAQVLLMFHMA